MEREFEIFVKLPNGRMLEPAFVTNDRDTFGILGEVISLIGELDPGDQLVINCYGDEERSE